MFTQLAAHFCERQAQVCLSVRERETERERKRLLPAADCWGRLPEAQSLSDSLLNKTVSGYRGDPALPFNSSLSN